MLSSKVFVVIASTTTSQGLCYLVIKNDIMPNILVVSWLSLSQSNGRLENAIFGVGCPHARDVTIDICHKKLTFHHKVTLFMIYITFTIIIIIMVIVIVIIIMSSRQCHTCPCQLSPLPWSRSITQSACHGYCHQELLAVSITPLKYPILTWLWIFVFSAILLPSGVSATTVCLVFG